MPSIIVENDISKWDDRTGEMYHFPKRYKDLLKPGEKVIYYKGKLKDKQFSHNRLSNNQHYFGIAEIGKVILSKKGTELYAEIINYQKFKTAVSFKLNDQYIEQIPENKRKNYWRDGVRIISEEIYQQIINLADLSPIHESKLNISRLDTQEFESIIEGKPTQQLTTKYERSPKLREQALLIHGYTCKACNFNFEEFYGEYAKGFIHIHHIEPLSLSMEKVVNPETDLIPLCANCYAIIHRKKDKTLTLDELKRLIKKSQ